MFSSNIQGTNPTEKINAISIMFHVSKRASLISKHEKYDKLTTEGYCMKCKVRREMRDEKRVRTKNGRSGISGMCTVWSEQQQKQEARYPVRIELQN
jgi:Domain of unknown function (DUF5679)